MKFLQLMISVSPSPLMDSWGAVKKAALELGLGRQMLSSCLASLLWTVSHHCRVFHHLPFSPSGCHLLSLHLLLLPHLWPSPHTQVLRPSLSTCTPTLFIVTPRPVQKNSFQMEVMPLLTLFMQMVICLQKDLTCMQHQEYEKKKQKTKNPSSQKCLLKNWILVVLLQRPEFGMSLWLSEPHSSYSLSSTVRHLQEPGNIFTFTPPLPAHPIHIQIPLISTVC